MMKKLAAMPYAQAQVLTAEDGSIRLQSYETIVAQIDADGWFSVNGLYSMTTRKHIGAFAKEYTPFDFQTAKLIYSNNEKINIHTGEVLPLGEG